MRDSLLIAGNGLAIALRQHIGKTLADWDTRAPLRWQLVHPRYDVDMWELFPHAHAALGEVPDGSDFDRMSEVLRKSRYLEEPYGVQDLRHYLAMAFAMYQLHVDTLDLRSWPWQIFLDGIADRLVGVLSFNYDTTAEDAVRRAGQRLVSIGTQLAPWEAELNRLAVRPGIGLGKPHGSIHYRTGDGTIAMAVDYPLTNLFIDNDLWLNRCYRPDWLKPRVTADIVIPTEVSRFRDFQWVKPVNEWIRQCGSQVRTCYIVGLSYAECDRPEINVALSTMAKGTRIVVADPQPSAALMTYLDELGLSVTHWPDLPPETDY